MNLTSLDQLPSSRCPECPLYQRLRYFVPATANKVPLEKVQDRPNVMFLGEAPGDSEVRFQEGFRGRAGDYLNRLFRSAGVDRSKVVFSNVLKCQPKNNKLPVDLDKAIDCCSEILIKDLEGVDTIIGLGNVPMRAIIEKDNITKRRGGVYRVKNRFGEEPRAFIPTLHPSFLVRGGFVKKEDRGDETKTVPKEVVVADIKKAMRIAAGAAWEVPEEYVLDPNDEEKAAFLAPLENAVFISVDIETTRDRIRNAVPLTVSFSAFYTDWSVDKDDIFQIIQFIREGKITCNTVCVEFETELPFIVSVLECSAPKAFHNGIFDVGVLENVGLVVVNWKWDTLYLHHLQYAELGHKLDFVLSTHTVFDYHKGMRAELEDVWDK